MAYWNHSTFTLQVEFWKVPQIQNTHFPQNSFPHNIVPIFQSQSDELEDWTTFNTAKDEDIARIIAPRPDIEGWKSHLGEKCSFFTTYNMSEKR